MLQLTNLLKAAFKSILKNRMRSLLTSLGIIIGVSAVIVMVAIGEGSQAQIEEQINSLGTDLIIAFPGASRSGGVSRGAGSFNRFTYSDVEKLREESKLLKAVSPVVFAGSQIIGGGHNWSTTVFGVSPEYFEIRNWPLESGEFYTKKFVFAILLLQLSEYLKQRDRADWDRIRMMLYLPLPLLYCTD